jgi:hypothetical protein
MTKLTPQEMKIFDMVEYNRTLAIVTDIPSPETCKVFYEERAGKFTVHGVGAREVKPLQIPEDFTKGALCEAVQLFQIFSRLNLLK